MLNRRLAIAPLPDRLRLPWTLDAAALRRDLIALDNPVWTAHFVTSNYSGDWSAMALRAPKGETHPIRLIFSHPNVTDYVDTPVLTQSPAFAEALSRFQCPLLSVRLMRLMPGSEIKAHRDPDLADADLAEAVARGESPTVRLHIPVITNGSVRFTLAGRDVAMAEGECWYLQLSQSHCAANNGASPRVHMVIDALANAWLLEEFQRAAEHNSSGVAE